MNDKAHQYPWEGELENVGVSREQLAALRTLVDQRKRKAVLCKLGTIGGFVFVVILLAVLWVFEFPSSGIRTDFANGVIAFFLALTAFLSQCAPRIQKTDVASALGTEMVIPPHIIKQIQAPITSVTEGTSRVLTLTGASGIFLILILKVITGGS